MSQTGSLISHMFAANFIDGRVFFKKVTHNQEIKKINSLLSEVDARSTSQRC